MTGWPFGAGNVVDVAGSPIAAAALVWGVAARVREGDAIEVAGVRLDPASGLARVPAILVARLGPTRWQLGDDLAVEVDADGVPGLAGGRTVPLELG